MENREPRSEGFKFPHKDRTRVEEAFRHEAIKHGENFNTPWKQDDGTYQSRWIQADRFLNSVQNEASGQHKPASQILIDVTITADVQPSRADLTEVVSNLENDAKAKGVAIDEDATDRSTGSIGGKIPLLKTPDLAISMFTNLDTHTVEARRIVKPQQPQQIFPQ